MLVTVAPCVIKGAAFDCLRDAIERRQIYREEEAKDGSRNDASPAHVRCPSAPDQGINALLYLAICQAPRSITGSDPAVTTHSTVHLCFNRNSFYLTYIVLSVFVRVCVYARLSYSLSFARLTRSPVVSRPTRSPNSSLLAFLIPWFETPVVLPDFYASARITSTSLVNPT